MNVDRLIDVREGVNAILLDVETDNKTEAQLADMAAKHFEALICKGGKTRAAGEAEIVRLIERFDNNRDGKLGQFPLSDFMAKVEAKQPALEDVLKAVIKAHKSGRYEPMVAAIEAAEAVLKQ